MCVGICYTSYIYNQPCNIAKLGDNPLGRIRPSVCSTSHSKEQWPQVWSKEESLLVQGVCLCVCNQTIARVLSLSFQFNFTADLTRNVTSNIFCMFMQMNFLIDLIQLNYSGRPHFKTRNTLSFNSLLQMNPHWQEVAICSSFIQPLSTFKVLLNR